MTDWKDLRRQQGHVFPEDIAFDEMMAERKGITLEEQIAEREAQEKEWARETLIDNIKDYTFKVVDTLVLPALTVLIVATVIIKMIKKELLANGKLQFTKRGNKDSKKTPISKTDNVKNDFIKETAQDTVSNIKANAAVHNNVKNYETYGLLKENPIYTFLPDGTEEYLSKLTTQNHEPLTYKRMYSTSADNINGLIDVYELYHNDNLYKTIYINMYSKENSKIAPKGFLLKEKD